MQPSCFAFLQGTLQQGMLRTSEPEQAAVRLGTAEVLQRDF